MAECSVSILALVQQTADVAIAAQVALNTVCSTIAKESKEPLDLRIKLLKFELESSIHKLSEWQELWTPRDFKSDASFTLLWGQAGQREITMLLHSIQTPAEAIVEHAKMLLEKLELDSETTDTRFSGSWFRWLFSLPSLRNQSKTVRDRLSESVAELAVTIAKLQASTDIHFRAMHASTRRSEAEECDLNGILKSRAVSTALYEQCRVFSSDLELDLNLLDNEHDIDKFPDLFDWRDLNPGYHLSISNQSKSDQVMEIRLESDPEYDASELEGRDLPQTIDSIVPTMSDNGSRHQIRVHLSSQDEHATTWLKGETYLHVPVEKESQHLSSIQQMFDKNSNTFSQEQKVFLAYRISEFCLFLLGTPWLAHLSSKALVSTSDFAIGGQYSLRIQFNEIQNSITSGTPCIDKFHMYKVGVLLVEIATEMTWHSENVEIPKDIATQIEAKMGPSYTRACQSCFATAAEVVPPSTANKHPVLGEANATLAAYYKDVFLRLRDNLHNIDYAQIRSTV